MPHRNLFAISPIKEPQGCIENFIESPVLDLQAKAQLRQSQRMEAIGRLAAGIVHDFNSFLWVISSYSGMLLLDGRLDAHLRDDVEQIHGAAGRAADLARQLLAFSRQQVIQPSVIDVNQSVARIAKMLRRLIGEGIELVTCPASELVNAVVDSGQLDQVIVNLAVNARDAMPKGGTLTITVRQVQLDEAQVKAHPGSAPGPHALLAVSDTGTGMDETTKARIFEPFFTTKGVGKGTGLGLATVFGIVRQSGGHLRVESAPGHGSCFNVYWPLAAGAP
jgi:two-component system cell cycle sensor histidine kinase/response regulator CckA